MIVLDTNVVSEMMRSNPHANVVAWLDRRPARELFVTTVTEAEVWTGIAKSRSATLATRNLRDFEEADIDIVNPWGQ